MEPRNHRRRGRPHRLNQTLSLLAAYSAFGVLHELAHLAAASWLLPSSAGRSNGPDAGMGTAASLLAGAARALLGRYSVVRASDDDDEEAVGAILRAGWTFSLILAVACHAMHASVRNDERAEGKLRKRSSFCGGIASAFLGPTLPVAAYVTALEAIATDLLGFAPEHDLSSSRLVCFCGNFGVLLLNPSWLSIDGGRTALDVLEKMVNVAMMRGAQSGGVVTFEPDRYSNRDTRSPARRPIARRQRQAHRPIQGRAPQDRPGQLLQTHGKPERMEHLRVQRH